MPTAIITSKGRVTIPRDVRREMGVVAGDRIDFVRMDDGRYAVAPASHSIKGLKGILPRRATTVSLDRMQAAITSGATKR